MLDDPGVFLTFLTMSQMASAQWLSFNSWRVEGLEYETWNHQEFQVPKMEVLNLIRLFWGWVFPYISLTYSLYR